MEVASTVSAPSGTAADTTRIDRALRARKELAKTKETLWEIATTNIEEAARLGEEAESASAVESATKRATAANERAAIALRAADAIPSDLDGAKKGEAAEPDEKTDAEKEVDRLKAGKLIRWGITGGVGPAVFIPLHSARDKGPVPGVGAVTYIMFHPGYWRNAPAENIYCANRWGGSGSETAASRAADDSAKERAAPIVDSLLAAQKAGALTKDHQVAAIICSDGSCVRSASQVRSLAAATNAAPKDATHYRSALTELVQMYTLDWQTGISGKCSSRMVGFWAGYPLKYTATVPYDAQGVTKRGRFDVTPLFAAGLGLSPNAYVSLLAGVSFGKVNLPPGKDQGGDDDDELVVSFLFGLGGNLDILGLLTK